MDVSNRLPREFWDAGTNAASRSGGDGLIVRDIRTEVHTRDPVAALLHLLTQLANCGLDAGAPSLLQSAQSEV